MLRGSGFSRNWGLLTAALAVVGVVVVQLFGQELLEAIRSQLRSIPMVGAVMSFIVAYCILLSFFLISMYLSYRLGRHEKESEPTFVLERLSIEDDDGFRTGYLTVKNLGASSENHIVKLIECRRISDGQKLNIGKSELTAFRTSAASEDERKSRFYLANGEPKKLVFCREHTELKATVIECEANKTVNLLDHEPYLVTVGLYCETVAQYRIKLSRSQAGFECSLVDDREARQLASLWPASA